MQNGPENTDRQNTLPNRFCYWKGRDNQPYLFTRIKSQDLHTFQGCIVLIAKEFKSNAPEFVWVGRIEDLTAQMSSTLKILQENVLGFYIHLLTSDKENQQDIIANLSANQTCRTSLKIVA
ncbi:MAG: hypothetical protein OIF56_14255 [Cohaesibacter sp.]|nr:hypothetical protein [Cohaesibacter sp.]MCV6603210.1 hypothetical protein [Cohaesibacter sp.]